jgi:fucose 4-O-acetylase-like acetyltransferase
MQRRADIDRAKGLAILLVVFGHIVARADPAGVHWYEPLRRAVYAFHMPFFLYLSGLAAVLSGAADVRPAGWPAFSAARAKRLLIPFFAVGFLILALKLAAGPALFVDNRPESFWSGLGGLVWETSESPARSVWYVFVVFVVSVAAPPLIWLGGGRLHVLLATALAVFVWPAPGYLYGDDVCRSAIFFALGIAAGTAGTSWLGLIDRAWRPLAPVFLAVLGVVVLSGDFISASVTLLVTGVMSMLVLHGFVRSFRDTQSDICLWLGRYSFMIYLFNTLFIGLTKGLLLHIARWNGAHFFPFAVALAVSGTCGPIALKRFGFSRSKVLDRFTN